jgi:hypothetical protein
MLKQLVHLQYLYYRIQFDSSKLYNIDIINDNGSKTWSTWPNLYTIKQQT